MATTMFFEKALRERGEGEAKFELEFGRSSYYRDNLIYIVVNGEGVIVDEETGREICEAMSDLAAYLGYDRPKPTAPKAP